MKDELIEILNFKYLKKWNISKLGEPIIDANYDGSISFFIFNKGDGSIKYSIDLLPDRKTVLVIMKVIIKNDFFRIYPKTYITSISNNKIDLILQDIIDNL